MKLSVLIRTKNEGAWIGRCLESVFDQDLPGLEVVVVDNESTDDTREILRRFDCRVVTVSEADFTHGGSINQGIEASQGDLVAILSGHCIPAHDKWLWRLALNFHEPQVAGAYGRQEPLPDTSDFDKRDLWTTFGQDRRVQVQDDFFHNANSMVRRSVWAQVPFNETLAGVEDRDWARRVLDLGHSVVYEPAASVYHYHGIHHGRDEARAARVARVIELIRTGRVEEVPERA